MGEAEACRFAEEGARVAVADIDAQGARSVCSDIGKAAVFVPLDVTRPDEWERAVAEVVATFGTLDILVNNAGFGLHQHFDKLPLEDHHRLTDVNQHGV